MSLGFGLASLRARAPLAASALRQTRPSHPLPRLGPRALALTHTRTPGVQKTIKNKGLRKRYLRVFGLSPFHK